MMSFERLALSVSVLLFVTLGGCASSTVDEAVPADDGGAGSSDVSGGDQTGDDGDQSGDRGE